MNRPSESILMLEKELKADRGRSQGVWLALCAFCIGMMLASNVGCVGGTNKPLPSGLESLQDMSNISSRADANGGVRHLRAGENLAETLRQNKGTVVLDFYADWCGPCKRQGTILETMSPLFAKNDVSVVKINVDQQPKLKEMFGVSGLPTLVLVEDGEIRDQSVGLTDGPRLKEWVGLEVANAN